jgi:hypothetical protein
MDGEQRKVSSETFTDIHIFRLGMELAGLNLSN